MDERERRGELDRASVRRAFERAAETCDSAAVLQREVAQRMAERLGIVRLDPALILDAGCGTGEAMGELQTRYPRARLIGVDLAYAMVHAARQRNLAAPAGTPSLRRRWLRAFSNVTRARPALVCADVCRLPIAARSVDLLWSNLALQWVDELPLALGEFHRALKVGGLLTFTTLGPDTLRELRRAFASADEAAHVNRFVDMHDVGDMLVHAGFADPVMDMEMITMTYPDATALMRDLKATGAQNSRVDRRRGLTGRRRWRGMLGAIESFRRDGRLPASFEVVYGHAWKPEPRVTDDGRAIVRFDRGSRERK
ncbi:MAG TPA: malonyl-ACP O-methyltransferase BioC [Casimicrobiaceae bacterium]|jgi:malonyl-CoA O-methyltransferase